MAHLFVSHIKLGSSGEEDPIDETERKQNAKGQICQSE